MNNINLIPVIDFLNDASEIKINQYNCHSNKETALHILKEACEIEGHNGATQN